MKRPFVPPDTAGVSADRATGSSATTPAAPRPHKRGLFRKYLFLIISLVSGALLASGAISLYFSYQENTSAIASLQHEKAIAAASRIEQYIRTIEQQLKFAALPQLDAADVEMRRIEFLKLLRQVPEVTDIAQLDAAGREQLSVSRLGMDDLGSGKDRSREPAFQNARRGQSWFSPVYFRKETEPYMTIAIRSGSDTGPVTIAEVNLKFIWDVVSRIKIGDKGKAYVVDRTGFLVADPDIGLVLRKTNLSDLKHVSAAGGPQTPDEPAMLSQDLAGTQVLASFAPIELLSWRVFVEQPVAEVYAKLNASIVRTAFLLLAGLVISALGALALARGMVRPIRTLSEGARRIGEGDLAQQIDVRTGDELETLANRFNHMTAQLRESYAGLERKVDERTHELTNSLEQQTAISEILRVISSSPGDVQPMLDAVAERALKLCDAAQATIVLVDGDVLRCAAAFGSTQTLQEGEVLPLTRGSVAGRAVIDRMSFQVEDLAEAPEDEFPIGRELQRRIGHHTALAVPLMRDVRAIGAIQLWRMETRAFTEKQIALVKTFADQAAIAIENVRLFNETKEALEHQKASAEVLQVISSSISDTKPVFDKILHSCRRLFDGHMVGFVLVGDDGMGHDAGHIGMPDPDALREIFPLPLTRESGSGTAILERRVMHYPDVGAADVPPSTRRSSELLGFRSALFAPLVLEGRALGVLWVARELQGPFSETQIGLLKTFADQAVIAIENVRLFNETKEALEQQTATAEILRVISGSITDTQPVFDAIVRSCQRLFGGRAVGLILPRETMLESVAFASDGTDKGEGGFLTPWPLDRGSGAGACILESRMIAVADTVEGAKSFARMPDLAIALGYRSALFVPLLRDGEAIGCIAILRAATGEFNEKETSLAQTFADQAVIAIENVRLFNETKEALEQQRASGDVLSAISSSISDTQPVFDTILQSCERLFAGTHVGVILVRDGMLDAAALRGPGWDEWKQQYPRPVTRDTASGIAILEHRVVDFPDVDAADFPPLARDASGFLGYRSIAAAPLIVEGRGIGALWVGRPVKGAFGDKQLALLKTFADQAVIAIENARLFNETKEALDQQRASGEVLAAISSSISDTQPVFDVILQSCQRLFSGHNVGVVLVRDDGMLDIGAYIGPGRDEIGKLFPVPLDRNSGSGTAILERRVVDYPDIDADDVPAVVKRGSPPQGVQSMVFAPMLFDGKAIGTLWVGRSSTGAFGDKATALLRTFADQAVIAIQNARLVNETRQGLERQTAISEILRVISSSPTDVQPVLDAIAERAAQLCDAAAASIYLTEGDTLRHLASKGPSPDPVAHAESIPINRDSVSGRALQELTTIHIRDMQTEGADYPLSHELALRMGHRTVVVMPLFREGKPFGTILLRRQEVRPFTDHEIGLLRTFGDQAAIALENVRLFNETKEALEQQQASGEVLAAISSSIADTAPVFERILQSCERLFAGKLVQVNIVGDDGLVHLGAYHGPGREQLERMYPFAVDATSATGVAILSRSVVHFPDADRATDLPERARKAWGSMRIKAAIGAPMLWEGKGIGSIIVGRDYAGAFSDKDIALLKTFADQAVIAIQNARLFREIQDKGRELEIANKHKSEFLANMSHELRTPLNAIIGFSEVLLERLFGELNVKQDDYLKDIHASGRHLLALINDILDLSKIEAGRLELELATFDLPTALGDAMTLVRQRAFQHHIELGLDVDPALQEVNADERKVKQILVNLLSNAVKFTPDGGRIDITARRGENEVVIAIRDTGIGIDAKDHETIFEEFRQAGGHYSNKREGTGLGLALARRFVELHGGRIWLDSAPGQGSTFSFTLPDHA